MFHYMGYFTIWTQVAALLWIFNVKNTYSKHYKIPAGLNQVKQKLNKRTILLKNKRGSETVQTGTDEQKFSVHFL